MRTVIRVLSALGVLVSIGWILFAPGFEPVLTGIGSVVSVGNTPPGGIWREA